MAYSSEFSRAAQSYLRRLEPKVRERIVTRVDALCLDPFDTDLSKPLHGLRAGTRSSRVGELRVIFQVVQDRLVVVVVDIGPRGDIYRG